MTIARAASAWLLLFGAAPATLSAQTSLTIYNDGRVLVRRSLPVPVPKGTSTPRVVLGPLDPASVFPLDAGVSIEGLNYDGAVDEASALRRSVGKRIVYRLPDSRDTLSAVVLGVDPLRLQLPDGRVTFSPPGAALYPGEVVVSEPTASLRVSSAQAKDHLRLGYFTDGASWQASYQVVLGRGTATVSGSAVIDSRTLRATDAEVQLLAGSVGRAEAPGPVRAFEDRRVAAAALTKSEGATQQQVGDAHLYSLPGRRTLLPGLTTTVALFDPASVAYERSYVVAGALPWWGGLPQQGESSKEPVEVSYTLKRPRKSALGERPLPGGVVRLFQADTAGQVQMVGEAAIEHTPAGQDLRVSAGTAFDLTAERTQTAYHTARDSSKAGWRTVATADYRVVVRNAGDSAATVAVEERRGGEWVVLQSSAPLEKVSSTVARFRVNVPARGAATLTYRLRVIW